MEKNVSAERDKYWKCEFFHLAEELKSFIALNILKETRNSYFCVTPKNHRLMFFSWKMLKSTFTKKVIVCFYNFRWWKFLKVAAYVIFPTSIMPLFEIYQRFKGHFLNELRVSFKFSYYSVLSVEKKLYIYPFWRTLIH